MRENRKAQLSSVSEPWSSSTKGNPTLIQMELVSFCRAQSGTALILKKEKKNTNQTKHVCFADLNRAPFASDEILICTMMTHRLQTKKKRRRNNHQGRVTLKQTNKEMEVLQLYEAERMSVYPVMLLAM